MKTARKQFAGYAILFFMVTLFLSEHVQARTITAPEYSLTDVTSAKALQGKFVKKGSRKKFLRSSGRYLTSRWVKVGKAIYYVDQNGNKYSGWVLYRGKKYRVKSTGLEIGKIFTSGGKRYYANEHGVVVEDHWITYKAKKYYADSKGQLLVGVHYIDGAWRYFNKNGTYNEGKKITSRVNPSKPMIALTFDDGPGQYTDRLLNCLSLNKARATFFMVGTSVPSHASTIRRMLKLHCELGNHSNSHARMTSLSAAGVASEFAACSAKIRDACGSGPTVCRLPYGDGHNVPWVLQAAGLPSIYWSVDTRDWDNTGSPQHTVNAALAGARDGAIILMHDIHYSTVVAAETIIPTLIARGYQLVTVSELARYKGGAALHAGRSYYNFY